MSRRFSNKPYKNRVLGLTLASLLIAGGMLYQVPNRMTYSEIMYGDRANKSVFEEK